MLATCPHCHRDVREDQQQCPHCQGQVTPPVLAPPRGFAGTCAAVLFRPARFFAEAPEARSRWRPLPFAVATSTLVSLLFAGWYRYQSGYPLRALVPTALLFFFALLLSPILSAAFAHGTLPGGRPYAQTLAVFCYATVVAPLRPLGGELFGAWLRASGLRSTQQLSPGRAWFAVLTALALSVAPAWALLRSFSIPSGAMLPTLQVRDSLFADQLTYRLRAPRRGEVIIFQHPLEPEKDFIKRVIAVAGDTVDLRGNAVYVNG